MITTVGLVSISPPPHILTFWGGAVRTFKFYSLSKFQVYNIVLIIAIILYIRSPELLLSASMNLAFSTSTYKSFSDLFHLAYYPPGSSMLSHMARFPSFYG